MNVFVFLLKITLIFFASLSISPQLCIPGCFAVTLRKSSEEKKNHHYYYYHHQQGDRNEDENDDDDESNPLLQSITQHLLEKYSDDDDDIRLERVNEWLGKVFFSASSSKKNNDDPDVGAVTDGKFVKIGVEDDTLFPLKQQQNQRKGFGVRMTERVENP